MKSDSYWQILSQQIFRRKALVLTLLFVAVLCFGFPITHYSIGLDDPAREYYLYSSSNGNMIQQGRLLHVVLNLLTGSIDFIPFYNEFLGTALLTLSALLYCGVFQLVSGQSLSTPSLIAFSCVYISYPILAEKYIYSLDLIAITLSYCCSAIALMYAYRFVSRAERTSFMKAAAVLMAAIASYESFIFLYICGVFSLFLLEILFRDSRMGLKEILLRGLKYAAILLASLIVYYGIVIALQIATGQYGVFSRYGIWTYTTDTFLGTLRYITKLLLDTFQEELQVGYLSIWVFFLISALGFVLFFLLSLSRRNVWIVVCFAALFGTNFLIHYGFGEFLARACQTFCFTIGFVVLILLNCKFPRDKVQHLLFAGVVLLVMVQSADINRWFFNDYTRYQKDAFVIHSIATDLLANCDVTKPVVFTNSPSDGYLNTQMYPGGQYNGRSVTYWAISAFQDPTQPLLASLFAMHGYDFLVSPTPEITEQAIVCAEDMPAWPSPGYLQEEENFIVVNFG